MLPHTLTRGKYLIIFKIIVTSFLRCLNPLSIASYPEAVVFHKCQEGVYDIDLGTISIRLLVLSQMPQHQKNALWQAFSAKGERVAYGLAHFPHNSPEWRSLLHRLYQIYQLEGVPMTYTMEDIMRDNVRHGLPLLSPKDFNDVIQSLPKDRVIKTFAPEDLVQYIPETVFAHQAFLQERRDSILNILYARFSLSREGVQALEDHLSSVTQKEDLQHLLLQAAQAKALEEFLHELSTKEPPDKNQK